jgi:hypothetical protein
MGGGGSSGGGGTSTTTQNIPDELKPLATAYTNKAIGLSDTPYTPYSDQRYADLNSVQNAGLQSTINRAVGGSQTMNSAEGNLNSMMSNQENPYLRGMVNTAMDAAKSKVQSQFSGSNYGTSANQEQLTSQLMNAANPLLSSAYESDQNRRLQAIGQAPTFGNQAYQDASQLMSAGQVMQDQNQQGLDFSYQQFQEGQNNPYKQLAAMGGVFGSNLGGSSTTTSDQSSGGK